MCTLTYAPSSNGFILVSSRDELKTRPTTLPKIYNHNGQSILYPRDEIGGGSWIAISQGRRIACLLNGAYAQYYPVKKYPKSRGEIVIKATTEPNWPESWEKLSLEGYESFTLVTVELNPEPEIVLWIWDEFQKSNHIQISNRPFILSSSTLYDEESKKERQKWFDQWINTHQYSKDFNLPEFHTFEHSKDPTKNILLLREMGLQTLSITEIRFDNPRLEIVYNDKIDQSRLIIDL